MSAFRYLALHFILGVVFGSLAALLETGSAMEYFIWVAPVIATLGVSCVAAVFYAILRRPMGDAGGAWLVAGFALVGVSLLILVAGGMSAFLSMETFARFSINYLLFAIPAVVTAIAVQLIRAAPTHHHR